MWPSQNLCRDWFNEPTPYFLMQRSMGFIRIIWYAIEDQIVPLVVLHFLQLLCDVPQLALKVCLLLTASFQLIFLFVVTNFHFLHQSSKLFLQAADSISYFLGTTSKSWIEIKWFYFVNKTLFSLFSEEEIQNFSSSIEYEFYKQRSHYKKNCKQKKEKAFIFYFKINFGIKQWLRSLVFFARSFFVSSDRLASIKRRICFTSSWTSSIRPMSLCLGEGYKVEKSPTWRGGVDGVIGVPQHSTFNPFLRSFRLCSTFSKSSLTVENIFNSENIKYV